MPLFIPRLLQAAFHGLLLAAASWREWSAEYDRLRADQARQRAAQTFHVEHANGVTEYEWR
jgi:hypothetical protein